MTISKNTMVSITEANQNFSKVARLVDEHGTVVILKNNVLRYLVIDFSKADKGTNENMLFKTGWLFYVEILCIAIVIIHAVALSVMLSRKS